MTSKDDAYIKRFALQIAAQMPEDQEDALAVLDHVRQLVTGFLAGQPSSDGEDESTDSSSLTHIS